MRYVVIVPAALLLVLFGTTPSPAYQAPATGSASTTSPNDPGGAGTARTTTSFTADTTGAATTTKTTTKKHRATAVKKFKGEIVSVDATAKTFVVHPAKGDDVTLKVSDITAYGPKGESWDDIRVGQAVSGTYKNKGTEGYAVRVHIGVAKAAANAALVKVFYATDRAVSPGSPLDYGPDRAAPALLSFGRFDVSIPKDHRLTRIERPSFWRLEFSEDRNKHFVIVARRAEQEQEFYSEAAAAVTASPNKEAFVFVHGFNVTFEDAVYRTAQLAYDLEFSGAAILYSWPSNASLSLTGYTSDSTNNDWTVPHLKSFLESVATRTGAQTVHLIAHSMGNRALANALAQIAGAQVSPSRPHFRQVVLTAPDIDLDTFAALAVSLKTTADRVTLYASANDRALRASKALTHYPRAGDVSGQVVIISGVDTIDVSAVDTDFIGHIYYGDNRSFLTDLYSLLADGKPPGQRFGLREVRVAAGTYWKFVP